MTIHFSEQLSFHRKPIEFERERARARANHAKNDAQKGCAMQLNGITLNLPWNVHDEYEIADKTNSDKT